eukprot:6991216-Prymnesium_polylepis.1
MALVSREVFSNWLFSNIINVTLVARGCLYQPAVSSVRVSVVRSPDQPDTAAHTSNQTSSGHLPCHLDYHATS